MTDTSFVEADNYAGVFDQRLGFGVAPAVITIDVMLGYTQEQYPFYCDTAPAALKAMQTLLKVARETDIPIIHIGSTATPGTHDGAMMMRKANVASRVELIASMRGRVGVLHDSL